MSSINLTNSSCSYDNIYNDALQAASQQYEKFLFALLFAFALKNAVRLAPVQRRMSDDLVYHVEMFSDVLAFFVTVALFYFWFGLPIIR